MSAEQAFAEFERLRSQTHQEPHNAEYRYLVQLQTSRASGVGPDYVYTWPEVQKVFRVARSQADKSGHICGDNAHCMPISLTEGTKFTDPANPTHHYTALGSVWVCIISLGMHTCLAGEPCKYTQSTARGMMVCTMTGTEKGSVIVRCSRFSNPEQQRAFMEAETGEAADSADSYFALEHETVCTNSSTSSSGRGKTRGPPKANRARKRLRPADYAAPDTEVLLATPPSPHLINEVRDVCTLLFGQSGIGQICLQSMRRATTALSTELARRMQGRAAFTFGQLASTVVRHCAAPLNALFGVEPSLRPGAFLPRDDIDYLAAAVARLLMLLRLMPKMSSGDNAVCAKGARTLEMCVPLLIILRDGIVGCVTQHASSSTAPDIQICTEHGADVVIMNQRTGSVCQRHVFVPAHPGLRGVLPNVLPPGAPLEMEELFDNMMRRERCARVAFTSVLTSPGVDPGLFCLSKYAKLRTNIGLRYSSRE